MRVLGGRCQFGDAEFGLSVLIISQGFCGTFDRTPWGQNLSSEDYVISPFPQPVSHYSNLLQIFLLEILTYVAKNCKEIIFRTYTFFNALAPFYPHQFCCLTPPQQMANSLCHCTTQRTTWVIHNFMSEQFVFCR